MNDSAGVIAAALEVQEKLSAAGFNYCIIGGLALQRWGEPRYTQDIDLTLLCPFGEERIVGKRLEKIVPPRTDDAVEFSVRSRVYLGQTRDGTPVDVALGAIDFEQRCVKRSSDFLIGEGVTLRTCSAEDLLVMKAFANRERDWADIAGIIARQGTALDWRIVEDELPVLLEVRGGAAVWNRLIEQRKQLDG